MKLNFKLLCSILALSFVLVGCNENDESGEINALTKSIDEQAALIGEQSKSIDELIKTIEELEQAINDSEEPVDTTPVRKPANAVVQTKSPDNSSSEVAFLDPALESVTSSYYVKSKSDYSVQTYMSEVYHIGRWTIDTIGKYDANQPADQVWQFTTQDSGDTESSNPYALVFASAEKAYVIRYGSGKVWIVNPKATTATDFKTGELDLSSYVENNSSGTPRPSAATIHGDKLFIAMQRLDDAWAAQTAYVAVFDVNTDTEIETNADDTDSVKGVPLTGFNPLEDSVTAYGSEVYITSRNSYSSTDISLSKIEAINVNDYSLREVLSADDIANNISAVIRGSVIVNNNKGYFFTDTGYQKPNSLYEFSPTTGIISEVNVANTGTENISYITLDNADFLWVSVANPANPGVEIIDTETNRLYINRLSTVLNPGTVKFIQE
ncbi:hypothetical protein C2869_01515 [Saccharobesus litoralis]|uniref:Uncharacterized protein n=1 Tax=Saccharobesus litoralis TaxID=2172099 RepID=A0A2S0VLW2_9ALTE|nr:hypothetical protein [Saccharobesus litoralis]AWB65201.1 hypothetical protein C2869_01515 [Saccharobesus litoralis]